MNTVINIAAGLLGVVVGATISWFSGQHQRKTSFVLELHREFNSPEMVQARYRAFELLRRQELHEDFSMLRAKLGATALLDVWAVVYFYQRLWLALHHGTVRRSYVVELFGDVFLWWYEGEFLRRLIPLRWEAASHIRLLHNWIERNSTDVQREDWRRGHTWFDAPVEAEEQCRRPGYVAFGRRFRMLRHKIASYVRSLRPD